MNKENTYLTILRLPKPVPVEGEDWIGFRKMGLDGQRKTFVWVRNQWIQLRDETEREWAAYYMSKIYNENNIELAFGMAIHRNFDREKKLIKIRRGAKIVGVYVEQGKREELLRKTSCLFGFNTITPIREDQRRDEVFKTILKTIKSYIQPR